MSTAVDVVVLGAGSGGEAVARDLAGRGLAVVVVEEALVGGECPFLACMPSKAMIHGAIAGLPWDAAVAHRDEITDHRDDSAHAGGLREAGVTLVRGRGRITGPGTVVVDDRTFTPEHIVLATGASHVVPPIDIQDGVQLWTSDDAWTTTERPDSVGVVGGGPVGIEIAMTFARYGARVVVAEREDHLASREDPEVADDLAARLRDEGVDVRLGTELSGVGLDGDRQVMRFADADDVVVDRVVVAAGKKPRVEGIGLDTLGIDPDEPLDVGRDGRVAGVENLWAVGDVTGFPAFTHTANALAEILAANLADGGDDELVVAQVPRCIFFDPPLAAVGDTTESDDAVRVTASDDDLARPATDQADPLLAVLSVHTDDRTVRGFSALGPQMDELVGLFAVAIRAGLTVDDLARTIFPFPTYSEVVRLLADRARSALDG